MINDSARRKFDEKAPVDFSPRNPGLNWSLRQWTYSWEHPVERVSQYLEGIGLAEEKVCRKSL